MAELSMLERGPDEAWWRGLARELEIEAAVTWLDWVPHACMAELYRAHDALLFPSLHDSSGNAVLEALAQGLLGGRHRRAERARLRGRARGRDRAAQPIPALCREVGAGARARQFHWQKQVIRVYADVSRRLEQPVPGERPAEAEASRG